MPPRIPEPQGAVAIDSGSESRESLDSSRHSGDSGLHVSDMQSSGEESSDDFASEDCDALINEISR